MTLDQDLAFAEAALQRHDFETAEIFGWNALRAIQRKPASSKESRYLRAFKVTFEALLGANKYADMEALGRFLIDTGIDTSARALQCLYLAHQYLGRHHDALRILRRIEQQTGDYITLARAITTHLFLGDEPAARAAAQDYCTPETLRRMFRRDDVEEAVRSIDTVIVTAGLENRTDFARAFVRDLDSGLSALLNEGNADLKRLLLPEQHDADSTSSGYSLISWLTQVSFGEDDTIAQRIPRDDPSTAVVRLAWLLQERHMLIEACERYHASGGKASVNVSSDGWYYVKIAPREDIMHEQRILDYFVNSAFKDSETNLFPLPMRYYLIDSIKHDHPAILLALNAGHPLDQVIAQFRDTGRFTMEMPSTRYETRQGENGMRVQPCTLTATFHSSHRDATVQDFLSIAAKNLAAVHALGPLHLAAPPLKARGYAQHLEARLAQSTLCDQDDRTRVLAGVQPLARRLARAHTTFVKDANPRNFGITASPHFENTERTMDMSITPWDVVVIDFGVALQAPPFYDLMKLLEHDRYLPREQVDAITREYVGWYNQALDHIERSGKTPGTRGVPIVSLPEFEFEREIWRPVQYLASYFHPKYAAAAYAKNRAFWMERGAETIDILLTQHASRFDADERTSIVALKPVFEKYLRRAEQQEAAPQVS